MKEIVDIRANEDWMQREFGDSLGKAMPVVSPQVYETLNAKLRRRLRPRTRQIIIDTDDPRYAALRDRLLEAGQRRPHESHYSSINVTRNYSRAEIQSAELFRLIFTKMFEPCGEDYGTEYDDSQACPKCGYGIIQRSPLRLNLNKVPKTVDMAFTIARTEWIISQRLADLMQAQRISGCRLEPVEHCGRKDPVQRWYQLVISGNAGTTVPPSRFAIDYITNDKERRFVCEEHSLSGLNLVSEVYIGRNNLDPVDLAITTNREGLLSGMLMPTHILLISPRFQKLLQENKIKGYRVEVAHLV